MEPSDLWDSDGTAVAGGLNYFDVGDLEKDADGSEAEA